jgi:hypothetical protein
MHDPKLRRGAGSKAPQSTSSGCDGLSDCDAHGTIVASMIAATPADPPTDAFSGIAPDAELISIRQWSAGFTTKSEHRQHGWRAQQKWSNVRSLVRAR